MTSQKSVKALEYTEKCKHSLYPPCAMSWPKFEADRVFFRICGLWNFISFWPAVRPALSWSFLCIFRLWLLCLLPQYVVRGRRFIMKMGFRVGSKRIRSAFAQQDDRGYTKEKTTWERAEQHQTYNFNVFWVYIRSKVWHWVFHRTTYLSGVRHAFISVFCLVFISKGFCVESQEETCDI